MDTAAAKDARTKQDLLYSTERKRLVLEFVCCARRRLSLFLFVDVACHFEAHQWGLLVIWALLFIELRFCS